MKNLFFGVLFLFGASCTAGAQIQNAKTVTAKVAGNCGMCQKTIEKAGTQKDVAQVSWDKETDVATITYDEKKTSSDAVLKKIAAAGYDNEQYTASDKAYSKLHECCQYERMAKK
jgi:copper chaperone CopZ